MRIPEKCNGCGKPLLLENLYVEDGCPCNTPKGVNIQPRGCATCGKPCSRPGHRLLELFGDAALERLPRNYVRTEMYAAEKYRADKAEKEVVSLNDERERLMLLIYGTNGYEARLKAVLEHPWIASGIAFRGLTPQTFVDRIERAARGEGGA